MSKVLPDSVKNGFLKIIGPPIDLIARTPVHPNFFTILGLIITAVGAYFYAALNLVLGGLFVLLGGLCDIIDGRVARSSGRASKFGAVFDSTLDRYAEFIMFFGVGIYALRTESLNPSLVESLTHPVVIAFIALGGSMMVSYVRSRAEALGYECKVGMMQRAERVVLIALGSMIHPSGLLFALWFVAIFANVTAWQRMAHVRKLEKAERASQAQSS